MKISVLGKIDNKQMTMGTQTFRVKRLPRPTAYLLDGAGNQTMGGSIYQMAVNENRLEKPLYRAPNTAEWKEVEWEWALDKIAENIKKSRDASFKRTNTKGELVNRTEGIASVGSAAMDLEECFTYQKFLRGLGLVYIEHQARI